MKQYIKPACLISTCVILIAFLACSALAANTDGTVTYSVKTINYNGGYDPRHVVVVWVVDADGNFVKTLCRHAASRINYLYKWRNDRGTYTVVDGVTSATLTTQPQTHTVVWDCRDKDDQIVPDGTYYFRCEYTSSNAQGPYMQWACPFVKGDTPVNTTYPNYSNANGQFTEMSLTYTPDADIAVTAINPSSGLTDQIVPIQVTVANQTASTASFTVTVNNLTPSSSLIGTQTVTDLAGMSSTTVTINWNTAGLLQGNYQIQAIASTLPAETDTTDNTSSRTITLSTPTASDISVTGIFPDSGLVDSIVPVAVAIENAMENPAGPFNVTLSSLDRGNVSTHSQSIRIASGNDDAEEDTTDSSVDITSSDLELVEESAIQEVGIRFQGVSIPRNATVTAAYIQFTGKLGQNINVNPISLVIKGQASDNADLFTTASSGISSRPHTTASVNWSPPDWTDGESGPAARTPDIKSVVQEIVNRPGWDQENSMVFMMTGSGARRAWSYNGSPTGAAQLSVEWETSDPVVDTIVVDSLAAYGQTNILFAFDTTGFLPGDYRLEAVAGPLANEINSGDNTLTNLINLHEAIHDVGIHVLHTELFILPNTATNITVVVTNKGDLAESVTTTLKDITETPSLIGSLTFDLPASSSIPVVFPWNTTGLPLGYRTLQAEIQPVTGETNLDDNTLNADLIISFGYKTNVLISVGTEWKYLDQGLDIAAAPWTVPTYYDGFWMTGPAPLGYGLPDVVTTVSYGPDSGNCYPTTYFRNEFIMDHEPESVYARVLATDGAVIYLNGSEIFRKNMPEGTIGYNTAASSVLVDPETTMYQDMTISPSNLVVGRNLMTAELHLGDTGRAIAAFALELTTVNAAIPPHYAVNPAELIPDGPVQSGDILTLSVTLTNEGNITAPCILLLRDADTGQVLVSQSIPLIAPGETATIRIDWPTFGATPGTRTIQAVTVCNGVTNLDTVASAPVTLETIDFSPQTVDAVGSVGGRCNALASSGSTLYIGCGATLECWDVTNPSSSVRLGAVRLPGMIEDLTASGDWVYAATGASGVQIIDATTQTRLVHRATFDSSGHARRVQMSGNLLYIADVIGGVRVLNVANPASPVLAGALQTTGPAQSVNTQPPLLLVMNGQKGLQAYQAADPAAIALQGACRALTSGISLDAVPGTAWATDASGGLFRIDVSDPANPVIDNNSLLPSVGRNLASSASALYVAAGPAGLLTVNRDTLTIQNTYMPGDEATDVVLSGNTLFVATGFAGCEALSVANPMLPQPLGTLRTGARPVDAAAHGSTLYVAADEAGLQIHSLQNLALPSLLGSVNSIDNARCIAVDYPLVYVADGLFGLKIFNVSNPAAPVPAGSYTAPGLSHIRRLALDGTRAVLTDGSSIHLLNIQNPSNPELLAAYQPGGFVFDITASNGEVYAACGGSGLKALRMDTLGLDTTYATPGPATGTSVLSNLLHVACGPAGRLVLNIDNPANPVLMHAAPATGSFSLVTAGPLLYLADGARTARALNVSAPLSPVTAATFPNLTRAMRVRAVQGLLLSAEDEAGLAIFNANPGDINLNGIPDEWEQQIVEASLATNGPVRSVLDVDSQAVGPNGFPYYQSYLAGLSPVDPNSVLAISSVRSQAGGGQMVIQWYSVPGKRYTLYKSTSLTEGFTAIPGATGITATGNLSSYTDTVTSASAFYMVVLTP